MGKFNRRATFASEGNDRGTLLRKAKVGPSLEHIKFGLGALGLLERGGRVHARCHHNGAGPCGVRVVSVAGLVGIRHLTLKCSVMRLEVI